MTARFRAFLLLFSLILAWPAAAASPPTEGDVADVRVEGLRRVEAAVVRNALLTKPGMPLDSLRLEQDLQRVWGLGFFSDAKVGVDESNPSSPVLVVTVKEKPAVRKARIRGNKELSNEDLKDIVDIKDYSILDLEANRRVVKKLQEKYIDKGYFLSEVNSVVEPVSDNEVDVFFEVNENAKVEVERITFVGNKHISSDDLKDSMQTSEGSILSFLTGAGTFREEVFQHDQAMLQAAYFDRGYIFAKIGEPHVELSSDKKRIYISIPITEGEQYRIGEIGFSGDFIVPEPELRAKTFAKKDDVFSRARLQKDIAALTDVYGDQGYAYANITPQTKVDPAAKTIDVTFDIEKGEPITVERIEITGNLKTRDKVIRRELRVYEGEKFTGTGLRESRQRVTALGFFDSVDLTFRRGSKDDRVVITVTVKEKATGTFQVGFGFSSFENFLFTAQVSQANLFGWGQTASFSAQFSSLRKMFQFSFVDPYFLDTNWIFSINAFKQDVDYFGFIRKSTGGDLTWGYHLTDDLMLHLGYAVEGVNVEPSGSGSNLLLASRFRSGTSSALRLTLNYDKRDNRLFPTSGNYQSLTVEASRPWLGASYVYYRYIFNSRWYQPLPFGFVGKAQGTFGYIDGQNLPISELFFLGGINSVRGYQLRSIAPTVKVASSTDPASPLFDFAVGGNKELIFNFELEFPIFDKAGIKGVVFYDMGNVYAENQNFFSRDDGHPLGMLHSVGGGIRWFSPIGPLRFELGVPLTRREQDRASLFEFTIGNFF